MSGCSDRRGTSLPSALGRALTALLFACACVLLVAHAHAAYATTTSFAAAIYDYDRAAPNAQDAVTSPPRRSTPMAARGPTNAPRQLDRARLRDFLAAEDVAAGAQSNFMATGERFADYASRAEVAPGYHDVIVHGTPSDFGATGDAWMQGRNFSHRALAQMLRRDPGYEGGSIRLLSCSTGGCGATAAQNLANELGVEVMAPTDTLWAFRSGRLVVGPEPGVPSGGWAYFFPGGR